MKALAPAVILLRFFPNIRRDRHAINRLDSL
jgi:hypothetical protein